MISLSQASAKPLSIKKILVGFDGSEQSRKALELAAYLGKALGAEIVSLTVADYSSAAHDPQAVVMVREAAHKISGEALKILEAWGARGSSVVREGDPVGEIVKASGEIGADLIVVGSRGLSTLKRILLGSVSQGVVAKSSVPVLVVK